MQYNCSFYKTAKMNVLSNFETNFKYNFDSDTPEEKSFPFFNLPDLVISKILKEYIPVTDKVDTLSQMPEFEPYLSRKSLWFQSTLKLFRLVKSLKSGWYVDYDNVHNRYYISVDYFNLNFTIHSFCSKFSGVQTIKHTEKLYRPLSSIEAVVKKFQSLSLIPVEQNDVLVYHWTTRHPYRDVFFWIFRSLNVVRTSFIADEYQLKQNKCLISNDLMHSHYVLLTLKEDLSIEICCETCGNLSCRRCKHKYRQEGDNVLLPLIFRPCDKVDPMDFSKCKCMMDNSRFIHAVSKLTFTEFQKENVLVINSHFIKTWTLANHNIISTWTDEMATEHRGLHWARIFLRIPFHKYKLLL